MMAWKLYSNFGERDVAWWAWLMSALFLLGGSMSAKDPLKIYRSRRDLTISPEPRGGPTTSVRRAGKKKPSKQLKFVIQKHAASHLHYDLRLEIDGVMVSWAVPKGPSLNPSIKHLAMRTDDHPLEYANFEGIIPEGSYGAGTVMIWDAGTYRNIKKKDNKLVPMEQCLKNGQIEVFLNGEVLQGGFALIETARGWLLIKMNDEYASARRNPVSTHKKSVKTGRTMTQIRKESKKKGMQ